MSKSVNKNYNRQQNIPNINRNQFHGMFKNAFEVDSVTWLRKTRKKEFESNFLKKS